MHVARKQLNRLLIVIAGVVLIIFLWLLFRGEQTSLALQPYQVALTSAFPDLPAANPLTEEEVALGRYLFYDPILSADSSISCASCHDPRFAFSDSLRFSTGVDQLAGQRNSMPIINAAWLDRLFWDGRAANLEAQALRPVEDIVEMHTSWKQVVGKLRQSGFYVPRFAAVYGNRPIQQEMVVMAIAQFERTLISDNSKYNYFSWTEDVGGHPAKGSPVDSKTKIRLFNMREALDGRTVKRKIIIRIDDELLVVV